MHITTHTLTQSVARIFSLSEWKRMKQKPKHRASNAFRYIGIEMLHLRDIPNQFDIISGSLNVLRMKCVTFWRAIFRTRPKFRSAHHHARRKSIHTRIICFIFKMTIVNKMKREAPNWLAIKYTCSSPSAVALFRFQR